MARTYIIGVDEAGRGPLAGPVAVGAVWFPPEFDLHKLSGVRDSKLHTQRQREEWFARLEEWQAKGELRCAVVFSSAAVIDQIGISRATLRAAARAIRAVAPKPQDTHILLDGLLSAPREYSQETIIHGDALRPEISLASIAAKVSRDRLMERLDKKYPEYAFAVHKGYGTSKHYSALAESGLCAIHRRSFCKKVRIVVE